MQSTSVHTRDGRRYALDIGSTVVKLAHIDRDGQLIQQDFVPRDFEEGIAVQVEALLAANQISLDRDELLICSSANGGLRVGIICLTKNYSGSVARNQVLLAGANPLFVHDFDDRPTTVPHVDMLIIVGGIDCEDAAPLAVRLEQLDLTPYRFGTLMYAGNRFFASRFRQRFRDVVIVPNPCPDGLGDHLQSVFESVRRAYLDDLVYKEGISELRSALAAGIRPTPEVASAGFRRAVMNESTLPISGACVLLDIGGATTDIHYTVEIVREDSQAKPASGSSVARYVFTDLGISASLQSLLLQLRGHSRLYELLEAVTGRDVDDLYRAIREGEFVPASEVLSCGCLFLALDRFAKGHGPGLPSCDLHKVSQFVLSGGAAQGLDEQIVSKVVGLLLPPGHGNASILIDRRYQIWVDGITCEAAATVAGGAP